MDSILVDLGSTYSYISINLALILELNFDISNAPIHVSTMIGSLIKDNLRMAHSRQKYYADARREELEFVVNDWIYLKILPLKGWLITLKCPFYNQINWTKVIADKNTQQRVELKSQREWYRGEFPSRNLDFKIAHL